MQGTGKIVMGGVATLADICRLWHTLTNEYIPGLRVELHPMQDEGDGPYILAELVDYSWLKDGDPPERSVWSRRTFYSPLYLISHTQLFDLLIVGYRVIDTYFAEGNDLRPRP